MMINDNKSVFHENGSLSQKFTYGWIDIINIYNKRVNTERTVFMAQAVV